MAERNAATLNSPATPKPRASSTQQANMSIFVGRPGGSVANGRLGSTSAMLRAGISSRPMTPWKRAELQEAEQGGTTR